MTAHAPNVAAWAERMLNPKLEGQIETWQRLAPTLTPLLRDEIAGLFLPWSAANAAALARGEEKFTVTLQAKPFTQETQKYHARSLGVLKARYATAKQHADLVEILTATGCHTYLV